MGADSAAAGGPHNSASWRALSWTIAATFASASLAAAESGGFTAQPEPEPQRFIMQGRFRPGGHEFIYRIDRMDIFPNSSPKGMYINKKIYLVVVFFVILGGLNWLLMGATGTNVVRLVLNRRMSSILYVIIGLCSLMLAFRRDVYLPFLGQTVFPAAALALKTPQSANESVEITTRPGAKVVYWAAEPSVTADSKNTPGWDLAYSEFENSGVVVADDQGKATLRIRGPPQAYTVPVHGKINSHVHFRIEEPNGFFGRVQMYYMDSKKIEGFADNI